MFPALQRPVPDCHAVVFPTYVEEPGLKTNLFTSSDPDSSSALTPLLSGSPLVTAGSGLCLATADFRVIF